MTLFTPLAVKRRHQNLHQRSPVAKCPGFPCQHRITATHAKINKRFKLQKTSYVKHVAHDTCIYDEIRDIYNPSVALPAYLTL